LSFLRTPFFGCLALVALRLNSFNRSGCLSLAASFWSLFLDDVGVLLLSSMDLLVFACA